MSLQSSNQDSSLEDEKAKREDRPSSSHLSRFLKKIQMKKNPATISRDQEKWTMPLIGNIFRKPSIGHNYRTQSCAG